MKKSYTIEENNKEFRENGLPTLADFHLRIPRLRICICGFLLRICICGFTFADFVCGFTFSDLLLRTCFADFAPEDSSLPVEHSGEKSAKKVRKSKSAKKIRKCKSANVNPHLQIR